MGFGNMACLCVGGKRNKAKAAWLTTAASVAAT